ncbi:ATPase family protein associated with various cellular activities (AAA) [Promicromonospora sp. AC04]|uniref:AAA family ATPase n=1 Tax=Promicromonospora sp. AC04 TaxID=2135723 RepID=UPI000D376386|nr:AAA family ATPase [Promicromonospora sp. AC04]PUB32496.1 ATPase family protein associated with various cellular activities (AAA) [Promicromonospora sp. AC04]
MPASTIVASGGALRLYGDSVQTYTELPVGTYTIAFSQLSGYSLHRAEPLAPGEETVYGNHAARVQRIITGYAAMNRSLGVILSGDKGMGKSLMIRMLAERMREQHGLPTILVQHSTPGLASFLDELGEAVVVFDEFEKVFANEGEDESQNQFLSLFDGLSTTKRLYVLSVNELGRVNDFMLNRPGRFHYHMRFAYPEPETVATYLRDQVPGILDTQVDQVVDFSHKYDVNFDHLRAIAFEVRLGASFTEVIGDLNIKRTERSGAHVEAHITWDTGDTDTMAGPVDLFDRDSTQSIYDWDLEANLRFRVRDAVPTDNGYLLPAGTFELVETREADRKGEGAGTRAAVSVVLRRPQRRSIDF